MFETVNISKIKKLNSFRCNEKENDWNNYSIKI